MPKPRPGKLTRNIQTSISVSITSMPRSAVEFTDYTGTLNFDPDNLKDSKISFEIKVKSIDTGISKRDKHLLSDDFFDASKYPLMTFTSTSITKAEGNTYNVKGRLTIKGVSSDLILPLTYGGKKDNPLSLGMEVTGFNGHLTLDRLAYTVGDGKYYTMGVVGKDVDILVTIEAMRKKSDSGCRQRFGYFQISKVLPP